MKKILIFVYSYQGGEITSMYLIENYETKNYELKEIQLGENFTNSLDFVIQLFELKEPNLDRLDYLDTVSHNGETYETFSLNATELPTEDLIKNGFVEVPAFMITRISDTKVLALFLKNFLNLAESKNI